MVETDVNSQVSHPFMFLYTITCEAPDSIKVVTQPTTDYKISVSLQFCICQTNFFYNSLL